MAKEKEHWQTRPGIREQRKRLKDAGLKARPDPTEEDIAKVMEFNAYDLDSKLEMDEEIGKQRTDFVKLGIEDKRLQTGNNVSPGAQDIIDKLWQRIAPHFDKNPSTPPTLVLMDDQHADRMLGNQKNNGIYTWPGITEYIFVSPLGRALIRDTNFCKSSMAHEIAHLLNEDTLPKHVIERNTMLPNEAMERLADRLGAIVHGNPREYSKCERGDKRIPGYYAMTLEANFNKRATTKNRANPPSLERNRMMERWADILEEQGGANPATGEIKDDHMDKALEIYEDSKKLTTHYGKLDSKIAMAAHSR